MKILLSNDDGIFARGIEVLALTLIGKGHDVYIVAPDEDASGTGHGLTINKPLRYRKYKINGGECCEKTICNSSVCATFGLPK